jgi:hypothetical protein
LIADVLAWLAYSTSGLMVRVGDGDGWAEHQSRPEEESPKPKQTIINHETSGVSTLPWVIIRETAIASNTCPVVYLCLNLLQEKRSRDNEDTTTRTGV